MRTISAAVLGLTLALLAGSAWAQLAPGKGPIDISADSQTADNERHMTTYKGRVEALQGQDRMRANQLDIFFKSGGAKPKTATATGGAGGFGDIDRMEATGDVYFVTPTEVIRGDKAVYSADADTITMTGDVVATRGENVERGSMLIVHVSSKTTEMVGNHGRVRTVIYPKSKTGQ
jgi:lipopolysaccharide export system protein LptA